MKANTATGLIGANAYLQETRVPMKVFKEARAEGDTAKMERAMGYVEELGSTALDYKKQADKGLKEEAKQAREEAARKQEELAQRIKDNRIEAEERLEESRTDADEAAEAVTAESTSIQTAESAPSVTYTKEGEVKEQTAEAEFTAVV